MTHREILLAIGSLALLCAVGRAQAQVKCNPNPTLKCVLDAASEAVDKAGPLVDSSTMAKIALIQKQSGDLRAFDRSVALAIEHRSKFVQALTKASPGRKVEVSDLLLDDALRRFLYKVGAPQAKSLARHELSLADPETKGIARIVESLSSASLREEARELIRRQADWYATAKLEANKSTNSDRAAYSYDILEAIIHAGESALLERWAAETWEQLRRRPIVGIEENSDFRGKPNVGDRLALARLLLDAKLARPTNAILADSQLILGPRPAPRETASDEFWRRFEHHARLLRLELRLNSLEKNKNAQSKTLVAMGELRTLAGNNRLSHLIDDLYTMLEADTFPLPSELSSEAVAIFDVLKAAPDTDNDDLFRIGRAFALLGDERRVDETLAATKKGRSQWEIPNIIEGVCRELVKGRNIEAALRCATRLEFLDRQYQANTAAVYADIAEALAKK